MLIEHNHGFGQGRGSNSECSFNQAHLPHDTWLQAPCLGPVSYTHLDVYKRQARTSGDASPSPARSAAPVSYTHLDVYKRQARTSGDASPSPARSAAPVSYTHLDVYKRQARTSGDASPSPARSAAPVSYTHLDVYKRQARTSGDASPSPARSAAPVSYTHLDVYKRQARTSGDASPSPARSAAPVSYTHLDVYKRQVHEPNLGNRVRVCNRADSSDPARNLVLFVTGMPGAGKTSEIQYAALHEGNRLGRDVRAIFEGQLVDPQASIAKVEQALSAGCRVGVIAVLPRPEEALAHTFQRFEELGRGASAAVMVRIQEGTPDGLEALLAGCGKRRLP